MTGPNEVGACRICGSSDAELLYRAGFAQTTCERCGAWYIRGRDAYEWQPADWLLEEMDRNIWHESRRVADSRRGRLSHLIRRQQRGRPVEVPIRPLAVWSLDDPLPLPAELGDNLLLWLAERQPSFDAAVVVDRGSARAAAAWIGAPRNDDDRALLWWLFDSLLVTRIASEDRNWTHVRLTYAAWERVEELRQSRVVGRRAFMAMKFIPEMHQVFTDCFKPAALRAGFELETVLEGQPAGLIDDQMRVRIRSARFVVSDLTHASRGAYWEAGFAEGLGRPAIYTCRAAEWAEEHSHFDTNHLSTIVWHTDKLEEAGAALTAMIRATLPA